MSMGASLPLMPADAFHFLLGCWQIERTVSGIALMEGRLTVLDCGNDKAEYRERVSVKTVDGAAFTGAQRYWVTRSEDGFTLCFVETRTVFEEVRFAGTVGGGLRAEAAHLCGKDWYQSEYVLGPGHCFTIRHAVTGPRKDYVSDSSFRAIP